MLQNMSFPTLFFSSYISTSVPSSMINYVPPLHAPKYAIFSKLPKQYEQAHQNAQKCLRPNRKLCSSGANSMSEIH